MTTDGKNDATTEAPDELDALEERRAKRLAERERAERKQRVVDLTARERLEDEHDRVSAVRVPYRPGQPTEAYVRAPTLAEYKRFRDLVQRAVNKKDQKGSSDASDQLARACWVYPETPEERESMTDAYPGILTSLSNAAAALAQGREVDEGKG